MLCSRGLGGGAVKSQIRSPKTTEFNSFLGDKPGTDIGPLISKDAKDRVERLIQSGIDEGANVGFLNYAFL